MTARNPDLELKLKNLPSSPGVYLFKNERGRPIYIGKAKNLRNRVRTYFHSSGHLEPRIDRMVAKVADVELMITANEVESLILEANLVHEHKPRYNVMLKDDKHFPYIKITTNEPFPRALIVRRLEKDNATYFGPFTSSQNMRRTFGFLTRLFRIRTCNLVIPAPEGKKHKVCLDYHINRCGGPCEDLQTQEEYAELVNSVVLALRGKSRQLVEQLTEKMMAASKDQDFEAAKEYRDQAEALKSIVVKQNVDVGEVVDRDIVAVAREGGDAVAVVMQLRDGVLVGRQQFQLSSDVDDSDDTVLETFLSQYYNNQPNLPDEICLPSDLQEFDLVQKWLRQIKGGKITLITPKIGQKMRLVDLAAQNARLLLDELMIQKRTYSERLSKMVTSLKDELKLSESPRRMVCFDISNTGDTDSVGSCVYFDNGKPQKSQYRHFKIKGVVGQDDFSMMREVIGRYFHRIREEELDPPDLVVVDGGKGQLSSALAELRALGFADQQILGLAKRLEEVFIPERSDPITIPRSSPALILLKRIRDEAHRFAITYNRKVRDKRTITSALDSIPGIGPARRTALLKAFGSVDGIRQADVGKLAEVKGINKALAEKVLSVLKAT
ncbi:MAG: excinuclease ABC subunit UvrC [candidate division Zixibacteria bacterium]|nr:excinuclease ABC subunit UvrC [candidate division Zixibacteria bacterium]